jgi:hypothetical protein
LKSKAKSQLWTQITECHDLVESLLFIRTSERNARKKKKSCNTSNICLKWWEMLRHNFIFFFLPKTRFFWFCIFWMMVSFRLNERCQKSSSLTFDLGFFLCSPTFTIKNKNVIFFTIFEKINKYESRLSFESILRTVLKCANCIDIWKGFIFFLIRR